jgi:hypothetical protein
MPRSQNAFPLDIHLETVRHLILCCVAIGGLVNPIALTAQSRPVSDSVIVHHVGAAIFRELNYRIARGALADSVRPVQITLPPGAEWVRLEQHLLVTLRARPARPDDRIMQVVSVDKVQFRGDTLLANFSIGDRWKCGDTWSGDHTGFLAQAVRAGDTGWFPVTTKVILNSDGIWCRAPDA